LITPHIVIDALGRNPEERRAAYRELFRQDLDPLQIELIRSTTNGGFVLGSDQFAQRMAADLGRRVKAVPVGRKKKSSHGD
jgi:putative transposase